MFSTAKFRHLIVALPLLLAPSAFSDGLPDLGDVSYATISPQEERRLGEQIMFEVRADRSYLDDAEVADYLNQLGNRLLAGTGEAQPDQAFEFFALQDPSVNAFALPGGFIGINSGLMLVAQSESELASVMAHEIAHVTQKHIARLISGQKHSALISLAGLAVAILAARANSEVGRAATATVQASTIQSQLDFTRDHEKEADRIGLNILVRAGFDPRAMPVFFERLQKAGRFQEGSAPSYLRTHPLTFERIADIQSRTQRLTYRQVPDSVEFQLLRAKLRAFQDTPRDALAYFESSLNEKRYNNEAAERYGLITALLRNRSYARAEQELVFLRKASPPGAMIETLAARVKLVTGQSGAAFDIYRAALSTYPQHRALTYDYAEALLHNRRAEVALKFISEQLQHAPNDSRLYRLQAQSYTDLGNNLLRHRAQAEAYARQGNLPAAIEQLQIALKSSDGDFYQISSAEARLRELRTIDANQKQGSAKGKNQLVRPIYGLQSGRSTSSVK